MSEEVWRDIEGFEGLYQVSDQGRVKSLERKVKHWCGGERIQKERILKPGMDKGGYLIVNLCAGGKRKTLKVHRLVCGAFLPRAEGKDAINHKDEDKTNNNVWNLEWVSHKENCNFGTRNERIAKANSKPVAQCTEEGELVKTWSSLTEIGKQTGFGIGNISLAANGKHKQAYGFIWKYV